MRTLGRFILFFLSLGFVVLNITTTSMIVSNGVYGVLELFILSFNIAVFCVLLAQTLKDK